MRCRSHAVLTRAVAAFAGLTVGAVVAAADPAAPPSPEINPPGPAMAQGLGRPDPAPPGGTPAITPTTPEMKAVQQLLGRAADDVTAGGRSADLLSLLARHDRDRMGHPADWADVDRAAGAFRSAWQARFGISFKLADKISIVLAEPNVHVTATEPPPAAPSTQPTSARLTGITLLLTGPGGRSVVTVRLANEGSDKVDWRFDLPDSVTPAGLHDTLLKNLTGLTADPSRWPTDVDQAYVFATQRALAALGSVDVR